MCFGCNKASVSAVAALVALSAEELVGSGHWCGKNLTVSAMCSAAVLLM
jgi:hypothetical protein